MGNAVIKDFLSTKDDPTGYLQHFSSPELLNHAQYLHDRWVNLAPEKAKDYNQMFDWSNVQVTANLDQVLENINNQENKEKLLVGMLPKSVSPDLLNPSFFDEVQTSYSPAAVTQFRDRQNEKFLLITQIFSMLQKSKKKDQNIVNILKQSAKFDLPKAAEVGIRSGVHLIISLLKEASEHNSKLKDETLDFLIDLFAEVKPLSLWGNKQIDVVLDRSLHNVSDYLEEVILSEKTSLPSKCKALKVLFSLGLLRGSLPNLLSVVSLLQRLKLDVDLSHELKLLKLENPKASIDFENRVHSFTKIYFQSNVKPDAPTSEKSPNVSITTDGKFLYIHSEVEGLLKIGTGYGFTMFGKIYKQKRDYRLKERGSIAYVLGKLYYRSAKIAPAPIIELDPETLEETGKPIHFDTFAPNSLFAEMTNPEIEFPVHSADAESKLNGQKQESTATGNQKPSAKSANTKEDAKSPTKTVQPKTTAQTKRDIRLMRPAQRSPMFTEGRFVYIISQWAVDTRAGRAGGADSDDEDEGETQEQQKVARYGVDIYDPLLDFDHVRSVELWMPKAPDQKTAVAPISIKALDMCSFTTNGSQLVIGMPQGCDEVPNEKKYKYFSLEDGKFIKANNNAVANHFSTICYDIYNNKVWSVNDNKKTFDTISCLKNASIPEGFTYPEESDLFRPYENSKIIEMVEEDISGLQTNLNEINLKREQHEHNKEELQLLMSLGLQISTEKQQSDAVGAGEKLTSDLQNNSSQLFILANIARLSERYASLDFSESTDLVGNIRKPYCIHLIDKTFKYLEEFVDTYSPSFFASKSEEYPTDEEHADQCSFLCTLRILKYNLAALGNFSDHLKKLGAKIISSDFPEKLEKLVWKILGMKPRATREYEELRLAIYQEALEILKHTLSIIYPNISKMLSVLRGCLDDLKSTLNRDIATAILSWLGKKDNISRLVTEAIKSADSSQVTEDLQHIVSSVVGLEVQKFISYIKDINDFSKIEPFQPDELITVSMTFLLNFQNEALYQLGEKIQEKAIESGPVQELVAFITETLSKNAVLINLEIQATLLRIAPMIRDHHEALEIQFKQEEEARAAAEKAKKGPRKPKKVEQRASKEELILRSYSEFWSAVIEQFTVKALFSQALNIQVTVLSMLSSNFMVAARTLKHMSALLVSFNHLYDTRKQLDKGQQDKLVSTILEKTLVFESEHPPQVNAKKKEQIVIPGAQELRISVDPRSDLKQNCDYLQFWKDEKQTQKITEAMCKNGENSTFVLTDIIVKGDNFWYNFHKDSCRNAQWGYRFTVTAVLSDQQVESDWVAGLHRSVTWLASKCAGQLINGSALQQAMLADEEQRYNALLNSKLFSGGMEKCYFSGGKEGVWSQLGDIINDFQAGHLSEYLSGEMTLEEKNEEEFLNSIITPGLDPQMDKTLDFIQKNFAKEALWANLGGDNGSRVVRAAYAVAIKHAGLIHDLQEAMLEVEVDDGKGKLSPNLKNLIKKWGAASRMRPWLVEKRKDIDDLEDRRKQQQLASKKSTKPETEKVEAQPSKKIVKRKLKLQGKGKDEPAVEEQKEEVKMVEEDVKEPEEPISQGPMQVRDTDEIINRMIDQIVKKAQFLCQLIPSQHWQQDKTEKKEKQLLFRSTSKRDEEVNKEEEWKRRLQQWKSVRQAKQVFKSLEDETQEIQQTLTTSVLLCLQSAVSIRRLRKQVESAYLRAICRTIGLNALTSILQGVQSSVYREDAIGWLCSSLRGTENRLYHFTDNLQGCGHYLESTVNTAFKNLIIVIVKSMAKSSHPDEIKCMLEALKWKYHGDDHVFLAEIDIFNILRGHESQALLRSAWGRSLQAARMGKVDADLVKKLLKLFETIVILCVGKLNWTRHESSQAPSKKDKLPSLERHVSSIDEYSVEILIRQAFSVMFSELENADKDYRENPGVNWKIYLRYLKKKELDEEKKKKPATTTTTAGTAGTAGTAAPQKPEDEDQDVLLFDEEELKAAEAPTTKTEKKAEPTSDDEDGTFVEELKEEAKTAEKQEESKQEKKEGEAQELSAEQLKKQRKRQLAAELLRNEERTIKEMANRLYNPDFLYRVLALVYKCVAMGNDSVSMVVGNPKYIAVLFSLLKHAPPNHQILLLKILSTLFETLPPELFIDSGNELNKLLGKPQTTVVEGEEGESRVVNHFLSIILNTRQKAFKEGTENVGIYAVSSEIVDLIRTLLHHPHWVKYVSRWINNSLSGSDDVTKQTALAILGGEFHGLRFGGRITINAMNNYELLDDNILLKSGWEDSRESATILGFTYDYKEKMSAEEKAKRDQMKPEEKAKYRIKNAIGSAHEGNNPVCLIDSSINKETLNFTTIELNSVNRSNCTAVDGVPFMHDSYELSKNLGTVLPIFEWALGSESKRKTKDLYTQALALKSLNSFMKSPENCFLMTSNHMKLVDKILELANTAVVSKELTNLEISEERLYRLLEKCCESAASMDELPLMSIAIKNNEVEVLLGKDLKCIRYTVQSGFNMDKINNKHYEAIVVSNAKELAARTDLKEYLKNKAVILNVEDINSEKYPDIILSAKIVITSNYDMVKFAEYYDKLFAKKEKKKEGEEESKQAGEEMMMVQEEDEKISPASVKLPNCLISLNDRAYEQILTEYESQKSLDHKDVFEESDTLKEILSFGFPKDICENYLRDNPKAPMDQLVADISKIIEDNLAAEAKLAAELEKAKKDAEKAAARKQAQKAREDAKLKEANKGNAGAEGQTEEEKKNEPQQQQQQQQQDKKPEGQEIQLSKGKQKGDDKDAPVMKIGGGAEEVKDGKVIEEETKGGDKKPEDGKKKLDKEAEDAALAKELEFKMKMAKAAEFTSGGNQANKEPEKVIGDGKDSKGDKKDQDIKIGKGLEDQKDKKPAEGEITMKKEPIEESKGEPGKLTEDWIDESEEEDIGEIQIELDVEKEDANPCFRCKGERELQNIADEKNKLYDDLIDFEGMNKIGRLVLFKRLTHNLSILYARRIIVNLLENWSEDSKVTFITDPALFPKFLRFLKLTTVEAMFSSTNFCNNTLINKIEKIIHKFLMKESSSGDSSFVNTFFDQVVLKPVVEIENTYGIKLDKATVVKDKKEEPSASLSKKAKKKAARQPKSNKVKIEQKFYSGSIANETEIDTSSLDYSLWMAQVLLQSSSETISRKIYRIDFLYLLLGIIPSIRNNRSLLWGVLIFALNMIDKFTTKTDLLDVSELKESKLLDHPNVKLLHEFFEQLQAKEKNDAMSRRTQIVSEILVNLNRLQRSIDEKLKRKAEELQTADAIKFKQIENLTDIVEMMQNYQENRSLLASTWLQLSSDLIKNEQKVIDGDHFYYKNTHTYKVVMPYAYECDIKFSEDCQLDPSDAMVISTDPEGVVLSEKVSGNFANKTRTYASGSFYVHFPCKGSDIIAFGANESNQFHSDPTQKGPVTLEDFTTYPIVSADGGEQHTWMFNSVGEIWASGTGFQTGLPAGGKNITKVATKDPVRMYSCGSNFSVFVTTKNEIYGVGSNNDGRLGLNYNAGTSYPQLIQLSGTKQVNSLACGYNHTILCTSDGNAYACGMNDQGQLGIVDDSGNKVANQQVLKLVNSLQKKTTIKVAAGWSFSLVIAREKGGRNNVWSCGERAGGKLGLGKTSGTVQASFAPITALEDVPIQHIHAKKKHAIAISHSGRIYSWGCGDQGQLGHGDKENQYTPKLMEYFADMKVISATTGYNWTAIVARAKGETQNRLYLTGLNPKNKNPEDRLFLPVLVESFEDKSVGKVFGGANHVIAITDPMIIPLARDTHKLKCSLTGEMPIKGGIYVDILNGNKVYSATAAESPDHRFKIPDLLLYSREALGSLEKINWPTLPAPIDEYLEKVEPSDKLDFGVTCALTGEPIKGVCYVNLHAAEGEPFRFLSQSAAFKIPEGQVSPTLYYRITRPLKKDKTLPIFPRTLFSALSETYGYQMKITPKYNEKGHEYMINKYKESFDAFYSDMKDLKPEVDEQLVDLLNTMAQKMSKTVWDIPETTPFPKDEVSLRNAIEKCSNEFLKKRFQILKNFNNKFKTLLPYIDFSAKKDTTRFRNIYAQASVYIFWDVKSQLFEGLLAKDAKGSSNPKIRVNRMKASKFISKGKPDHTGEFTVFGQIYQHFKSAGYSFFKIPKDQNPFTVQFVGEASIDAGGPYREAVSQLCTELQSGALPLLIPSPNQKNDSGQFREKWVLNPSANSLIHLQMYEFLGVIMGCSIRTRNFLNLDLPSMVWKQLVDVPVNRKDLENIDRYLIQCLDDIINIHKKGVDENSFSEIIQEKFVTTLSDGSEVELIPGGRSKIVT